MEGANITILIAFVAGLASFLSPCVLPLVPGYISLMSGVSAEHLKGETGSRAAARRAVILNSLAFNAGLSMIFVSLGAAAGLVGAAIISNPWVRIIGGVVIIAFGLQLIGLLKIGALYRDTRKFSDAKPRGLFGSFALGLAFAAGWTPCIGPILGGIIGLAATSGGWKSGLVLSAFYAAGLAVPFLLTGLLLNQFLGFYTWFRRHLHKVEVASGVLLIAIGLLIATNNVTRLASIASKFVPNAEGWVESRMNKPQATATTATTATGTNGNGATTPPVAGMTLNAADAKQAPEIELKTLDGQPFSLASLRGRVVILNFWATWCVPCRAEIPDLSAMQRDLASRGLTVVGVSADDTADDVRDFQKELKQDYTVVLGTSAAKAQYGVVGLPRTFIIDRAGRIRRTIPGERARAQFEADVLPLLDEKESVSLNK
ncbi:MAG: cytochrome c-type biosis protein [Acidobacteriota bacterium]|jgi:cytochrome c-type biogenesis protein|nr:cytochrome c-type biosis protein [Acidobacteriota bacterium]